MILSFNILKFNIEEEGSFKLHVGNYVSGQNADV